MMGQGDKKIRIRRTNEQLDKEVISEFEKLVGEFGFGNVNLSALMKAADLEANVFYRRYGSMDNLYDRLAKQYDFWINNTIFYRYPYRQDRIRRERKVTQHGRYSAS